MSNKDSKSNKNLSNNSSKLNSKHKIRKIILLKIMALRIIIEGRNSRTIFCT